MSSYPWHAVVRGLASGVLFPGLVVGTRALGMPGFLAVLVVVAVSGATLFGGMAHAYRRAPEAVSTFFGAYIFGLTSGILAIGWRVGIPTWQLLPLSGFAIAGLWWMAYRPTRG